MVVTCPSASCMMIRKFAVQRALLLEVSTMSSINRRLPRRQFLVASAALGLAACGNGVGNTNANTIDSSSDVALDYLFQTNPEASSLADQANGILIFPQITEGSFLVGGSYGTGALRIGGQTVDYYSAAQGTVGLQIGAQQYSHALFFLTPEALRDFRESDGWAAGANISYATDTDARTIGFDSTRVNTPVVAFIFAQAGAIAGATLEGTKYTRIIP